LESFEIDHKEPLLSPTCCLAELRDKELLDLIILDNLGTRLIIFIEIFINLLNMSINRNQLTLVETKEHDTIGYFEPYSFNFQ